MGDLHKIVKAKDKKFSDPEFEGLLHVHPEKLSHKLSKFYTRPAYAHTSSSIGGIEWDTEPTTN